MNRKNRKRVMVKICPRCKSLKVKIDWRFGLVFLGLPPRYKCLKCGYSSEIFPEIDLNEFKKRKK